MHAGFDCKTALEHYSDDKSYPSKKIAILSGRSPCALSCFLFKSRRHIFVHISRDSAGRGQMDSSRGDDPRSRGEDDLGSLNDHTNGDAPRSSRTPSIPSRVTLLVAVKLHCAPLGRWRSDLATMGRPIAGRRCRLRLRLINDSVGMSSFTPTFYSI